MSGERGFTLIEVLLAGALLAFSLLLMAGMMTSAYRNLDRSGEQTSAAVLDQQRIEMLRTQGYAALTAGTTNETLTGTYAGYTRDTTIATGTPVANVKQITVRTTTPSGLFVQAQALVAK